METEIQYIVRKPGPLVEKAFTTDYPIDHVKGVEGIRSRNIDWESRQVTVEEISDPSFWKLDVHGFCFLRAETHIDPDKAYRNKDEVKDAYWHEIEAILHEKFPCYSRIEAFDITVGTCNAFYPGEDLSFLTSLFS